MSLKISGAACAAALLFCTGAHAHHPSPTGGTSLAGPINVFGAETLRQGQTIAGVAFETIALDSLSDAVLRASAMSGEHTHGHGHGGADKVGAHSLARIETWWAAAAYGVTDDLTVSMRLPYVSRHDIREGLHFHHHPTLGMHVDVAEEMGRASGIGDLTLLGQYRVWGRAGAATQVAFIAGLEIPTGRTSERTGDGDVFEAEFQPGSGSWDVLLGGAMTQRLGGPWSLHASALYTLASEGTQDVDLGDRFHYGAALAYRLAGYETADAHRHAPGTPSHVHAAIAPAPALSVDLVLELNGDWSDKQAGHHGRDPDSGGHTLYLSPGLRLGYGRFSGFISAGVPVHNDLNGLQAEPDWRLVSGFTASF